MQHEKFHYKDLTQLRAELERLGISLPLSENLACLQEPLTLQDGHTVQGRIAIQPMEGCDGNADGSPAELTLRRYRRFAGSGAGLIWAEAVAVTPEGRANPRQLWLTEDNLDAFKAMTEQIREISLKENGFAPLIILQATHSGRYSKPTGTPAPIIAYQNPLFEKDAPIDPARIITDDRLKELEEAYGKTARLAEAAGFDGVDIKACHRYLVSELLSAYNRPGAYGGSFENRTRFYRNALSSAKAHVSGRMLITSRLNVYDGFPYPYGFGVSPAGGLQPDLAEPIRLVKALREEMGMELLDITIGNPYVNPHVNRPYDAGPYVPEEHPLEGVARMFACIGQIARAVPGMKIISSGHSYLRQLAPYLAAGAVETGVSAMAGFGREFFAYPDFPRDLFKTGALAPEKCCIACGKCSELMRAGSMAGCVVRDAETYLPLYQRDVLKR
ncbi:MAG TPA: flavin oxidoreductase/NADH oxidase [Firmicutes bacterium]|nr:flavin oxidoreductase/NADH oxidase [Bacillota bacterium]